MPEASGRPDGATPGAVPLWELAPLGDSGLIITWRGAREVAGAAIRELAGLIATRRPAGLVELVPGIETLLVCYDPLRVEPDELQREIERDLPRTLHAEPPKGATVEIPVCYGGADGPDLPYVAQACSLSEADVIALHTSQPMPVLMIGFLPGFPYIGQLPPALHLPRRAEPRTAVAAGSVAIANDQTGIYPDQSPGGWHVIGRTDLRLFDPLRDPPALLRAGDYVRFVAEPRTRSRADD